MKLPVLASIALSIAASLATVSGQVPDNLVAEGVPAHPAERSRCMTQIAAAKVAA